MCISPVRSVCAWTLLYMTMYVWSVHCLSSNSSLEQTVDSDLIVSPQQEYFFLRQWSPRSPPAPLSRCDALVMVNLLDTKLTDLPPRWVGECPRLLAIIILHADKITRLPNELLFNAAELVTLTVSHSALEELPPDLFYYSPKLELVVLSWNFLKILPSEIFKHSGALVKLELSKNQLEPRALEAFTAPALQGLLELKLDRNPTLYDLCNSSRHGISKLSTLSNLTILSMAYTNITTICRDWRTKMPFLELLDLQYTHVSRLQHADLEFVNSNALTVNLEGAPVTSVLFNEKDYYYSKIMSDFIVTVKLDPAAEMQCNCSMYWTWRALRDRRWPAGVRVKPLRCADDGDKSARDLLDVNEYKCTAEYSALPAGCTSWERYVNARADSRYLRVSCAGAGLTVVPSQLRNITESVDLLLTNNHIDRLHLDQLPPNIQKLDLSNNTLRNLDIETATGLVIGGRRVNISFNPWLCECGDRETVALLQYHSYAVEDFLNVKCVDGRDFKSVNIEPCPSPLPFGDSGSSPLAIVLGASFAALVVVTCVGIACLIRRDMKLFGRVLLDRAGLRSRDSDEHDGCMYDAFLSFSHEDEEPLLEIVRWLESRSPPYRLCLHYRDWVPGRSIPEQISESVVGSRRTITLVSSNFLRSTWARAEFREAHAHALRNARRRLVVVLMEDMRTLALDAELRRYIALNTYVQWGDPWFWDKLRRALPRPRRLPSPPTPSLQPSPKVL